MESMDSRERRAEPMTQEQTIEERLRRLEEQHKMLCLKVMNHDARLRGDAGLCAAVRKMEEKLDRILGVN